MNYSSKGGKDINQEFVNENRQPEITRRAYELYTLRGYVNGHELDDWLQAESEVMEASGRKAA
jgi:hypothetical protein